MYVSVKIIIKKTVLGMVVHACNPNTWEAETSMGYIVSSRLALAS
jgi:hypothetical protein